MSAKLLKMDKLLNQATTGNDWLTWLHSPTPMQLTVMGERSRMGKNLNTSDCTFNIQKELINDRL